MKCCSSQETAHQSAEGPLPRDHPRAANSALSRTDTRSNQAVAECPSNQQHKKTPDSGHFVPAGSGDNPVDRLPQPQPKPAASRSNDRALYKRPHDAAARPHSQRVNKRQQEAQQEAEDCSVQ